MLGLMLVLTVSSAYKRTFALCDSLSLGGNLIAAGVDWGRGLPCPSHLESEETLRLINIQRLVELDCSRGCEILNIHVHPYSVQYFMLPHHFSMALALALFVLWNLQVDIFVEPPLSSDCCPGLFSLLLAFQQTHTYYFACKLTQAQHDYHIFHLWLPKPCVYMQKQPLFGSSGVMWCGICRRETDRLLSDMRWLWCVVCM